VKRVAILQSNYIPWKGYFDLIAYVDEFILYDDMQYTRRDWRNRNQIKTPDGLQWLTVPVKSKGNFHQAIKDTEIDGAKWQLEHWKAIQRNYARTKHFSDYSSELEKLYKRSDFNTISDLNRAFIDWINAKLNIETKITKSSDYSLIEGKSERLANLCTQAQATEYVSGPSAKDYLDESIFEKQGIEVTWFDYAGYPEYPQLWGEFAHNLSVLDLLLNCGPDSANYMKFVPKP
jgi:hypothetical protein